MSEQYCPHCQAEIPRGTFRCPECGIDIREWDPDKMRCPVCRAMYPRGTKFCLNDGSNLEPAVVDFDSEATMFLPGSGPQKKDDLIPHMKFAEDPERIIPKMERDDSGKIMSPQLDSSAAPDSDIIMPDINHGFDDHHGAGTVKETIEKPATDATPEPAVEEEKIASPPEDEKTPPASAHEPEKGFFSTSAGAPTRMSPKDKKTSSVRPLSEYERLIKEAEEEEKKRKQEAFSDFKPTTEQKKALRKRGFIRRMKDAIRLIFGK